MNGGEERELEAEGIPVLHHRYMVCSGDANLILRPYTAIGAASSVLKARLSGRRVPLDVGWELT